jgi:hypothetical protein
VKTFGNHRKTDVEVNSDADRKMLNVTKKLIDSDELKAIGRLDNEIRRYMYARSCQSPLKQGIYMLSPVIVLEVLDTLKEFVEKRKALVEMLIEAFPEQKKAAKARLGDQYNEKDYPKPQAIRDAFDLSWQFVGMDTPDELKLISPEAFEEERRKSLARIAENEQQIMLALRETFHEMIAHMADKLKNKDDGKKKIFRDSSLENITEFCELYKQRTAMIVDDPEMNALVDAAKKLTKGFKIDDLRNDDDFRATIKKQFIGFEKKLEKMIVDKPKRSIRFAN